MEGPKVTEKDGYRYVEVTTDDVVELGGIENLVKYLKKKGFTFLSETCPIKFSAGTETFHDPIDNTTTFKQPMSKPAH